MLAVPLIMLAILAMRIGLDKANLPFTQAVNFESWCCVQPGKPDKARILAMLEKAGGRHLVIVKPKDNKDDFFQWIYNGADIDQAPVVWARDIGLTQDRALLEHFRDRKVWQLDPNAQPPRLTPFSGVE